MSTVPESIDIDKDVAVIGMAGRFPESPDLQAFWRNIISGKEHITDTPEATIPNIVNRRGILGDIDLFDAGFFSVTAGEAKLLDPQHRVFLEVVWHALENAGVKTDSDLIISLYGACAPSSYLVNSSISHLSLADQYQIDTANSPDFMATRVSYLLNLRGESLLVQTGCSSSLTAVHFACQSLLSGQSQISIAGGVTITADQESGYCYQEGMVASPDGHCRPFDHRANGSVPSSGVGVVVLKLAEDALKNGDHIWAIIKASDINNDGRSKIGFMAPSINGQAEVIGTALKKADVPAESIGYIETHGTGTRLGDLVEMTALTRAFRLFSDRNHFCAIGSLKANFGHMDRAAGIAGLIKVVLCLAHKQIPPLLNFEFPNPEIDWSDTPFYVPTQKQNWCAQVAPLSASVSSFGVGGTNAHIILQESPSIPLKPADAPQVVTLSARSQAALNDMTQDLGDYLVAHPNTNIESVAVSRNLGRATFDHRRAVVACSSSEAANAMRQSSTINSHILDENIPIVFMFPGHGIKRIDAKRAI